MGERSNERLLGSLEELMLLAILKLRENAYGVTLKQVLEEATGRPMNYGAVYITLQRL